MSKQYQKQKEKWFKQGKEQAEKEFLELKKSYDIMFARYEEELAILRKQITGEEK